MYINFFSRQQLCVQVFAGFVVFSFAFKIIISKIRKLMLWVYPLKPINRLLTDVSVLVNGIVFNRFK